MQKSAGHKWGQQGFSQVHAIHSFTVTLLEPDVQAMAAGDSMAKLLGCFSGIFLLFATKGRALCRPQNDLAMNLSDGESFEIRLTNHR
ncbi:MAG: hypothetical protein Q8Q74_00490 [Polaromonas sp.]|nr:hypothetical protein [Polaromonas sp.]